MTKWVKRWQWFVTKLMAMICDRNNGKASSLKDTSLLHQRCCLTGPLLCHWRWCYIRFLNIGYCRNILLEYLGINRWTNLQAMPSRPSSNAFLEPSKSLSSSSSSSSFAFFSMLYWEKRMIPACSELSTFVPDVATHILMRLWSEHFFERYRNRKHSIHYTMVSIRNYVRSHLKYRNVHFECMYTAISCFSRRLNKYVLTAEFVLKRQLQIPGTDLFDDLNKEFLLVCTLCRCQTSQQYFVYFWCRR